MGLVSQLKGLFTEHPRSVSESYWQHLSFAWCAGLKMLGGGIVLFIHGLFPFMWQATGSRIAKDVANGAAHRKAQGREID